MTMPLAQQALLWGLGCFAFLVVLWLSMSRSKWREELGDTGDLDTHLDLSHPFDDEPRRVGKHPALGASYRQGPVMNFSPREVILTPRDLEHINIGRRQRGKPPLNENGFRAAIAAAARQDPELSFGEWETYLLLCEVANTDHHSVRVAVAATITIPRDAPAAE